jgi:hypothetical protein
VIKSFTFVLASVAWLASGVLVAAQGGRGASAGSQATPRGVAPVDLAGYWVSVVSEDWRFRMMTPPKGDYGGVPLRPDAVKITEAWDPDNDAAAGTRCKAYGAPALMRIPGRLHITWQDDTTLKIETDAGQQTRLLHFGPAKPPEDPQLQGHSVASWELAAGRSEGGGRAWGSLRVATTRLQPGYLRRNGVPYSGNIALTEYFDQHVQPNGEIWLTITTIVSDPTYLTREFITSTDFKKEPDGARWNPAPCQVR